MHFPSDIIESFAHTSSNHPLHDAIFKLDVAELERLLITTGAYDINEANPQGWAPLHCAVYKRNMSIIECLLGFHPDLNRPRRVEAFSSLELEYTPNYTPLHLAVRGSSTDVVHALLRAGADPDALDEDATPPLFHAVRLSLVDVLRALLNQHATAEFRHEASGENLLHYIAHSSTDEDEDAAAAINESKVREMICLLHSHGAQLDALDDSGLTPLHTAICHDKKTVARCLLELGANVNAKDSDHGFMPIHYTAGHHSFISLLLENGAKIDSKATTLGFTSLHLAALSGELNSLKALIDHGANTNERDLKGRTPLHHAAKYPLSEKEEVINCLLSHGAQIEAVDHKNQTALHHAVKAGNQSVFVFLNQRHPQLLRMADCAGDTPADLLRALGLSSEWLGNDL